jgi:hypothetical protein
MDADILEFPRRSLGNEAIDIQMAQHVPLEGRSCYCFTFHSADEEVRIYIDESTGLPLRCQSRQVPGPKGFVLRWSASDDAPWNSALAALSRDRAKSDRRWLK